MGGAVVLTGVIFVIVLVGQVCGQDIGNCNRTAFTTGGQQCQRIMMTNLKNNSSLSCSDEYTKQSSCLSSHVTNCVKNTELSFAAGEIVKLLSLLLYHCGSFNFDIAKINPIVLGFVQCDAADLNETLTCWDDFRSTFNTSRNDSSLCRKFAKGKEKCTDIARRACPGICEYITKDEYNPFCSNTMDPADTSNFFDCIQSLGCSNKVVYENAIKCEKLSFEDFAKSSAPICSVELNKNKDCLRQNLVSECPAMQKNDAIFDDVVKTLRSTLMTQQFFCDPVTLNKASLHREAVTTADCEPQFFTDVETECAKPFRKIYAEATEKKSAEVCSAFAEAKKCLNKAHEGKCNFDESTQKAAMFDEDNPFCESGKDPQKSGVSWAQATILEVFISSMVVLFAVP
ncbi:hypothetical protein ACROYT_G041487 [Oculina patagonica]